jgi:hypothetical protein
MQIVSHKNFVFKCGTNFVHVHRLDSEYKGLALAAKYVIKRLSRTHWSCMHMPLIHMLLPGSNTLTRE